MAKSIQVNWERARVRKKPGGVIRDVLNLSGEEDGEEKGPLLRLCVIGKVKAHGVLQGSGLAFIFFISVIG